MKYKSQVLKFEQQSIKVTKKLQMSMNLLPLERNPETIFIFQTMLRKTSYGLYYLWFTITVYLQMIWFTNDLTIKIWATVSKKFNKICFL